jgi:hypothetical protein
MASTIPKTLNSSNLMFGLVPEAQLVSSDWPTGGVGPRSASKAILGLLAPLKPLALGALGTGFLFVAGHVFISVQSASSGPVVFPELDQTSAAVPVPSNQPALMLTRPSAPPDDRNTRVKVSPGILPEAPRDVRVQ